MEIWIAAAVIVVIGISILFLKKRKNKFALEPKAVENGALVIRPEVLPSLSEKEEASLVEITDRNLLAKIDNLIPGLLQPATAAATAIQSNGSNLYRVIIPTGAKLTDSKAMAGASRGFYRGPDGIQGHANLVRVDGKTTAVANAASAAMGVASVVVGQYYMSQINAELSKVNKGVEKISDFQNTQFAGEVEGLLSQIQKITRFKDEIIESPKEQHDENGHLENLEDKCADMLGQATKSINNYCGKISPKYNDYEEALSQAQKWCAYQNVLLEMLYRIADLKYVLSLGSKSKEYCGGLLENYTKQAAESRTQLAHWHEENAKRLGIETSDAKRKRDGFDYVLHWVPGRFNKEQNFRPIAENTLKMIEMQAERPENMRMLTSNDLYESDVQLISRQGKLYYLPEQK